MLRKILSVVPLAVSFAAGCGGNQMPIATEELGVSETTVVVGTAAEASPVTKMNVFVDEAVYPSMNTPFRSDLTDVTAQIRLFYPGTEKLVPEPIASCSTNYDVRGKRANKGIGVHVQVKRAGDYRAVIAIMDAKKNVLETRLYDLHVVEPKPSDFADLSRYWPPIRGLTATSLDGVPTTISLIEDRDYEIVLDANKHYTLTAETPRSVEQVTWTATDLSRKRPTVTSTGTSWRVRVLYPGRYKLAVHAMSPFVGHPVIGAQLTRTRHIILHVVWNKAAPEIFAPAADAHMRAGIRFPLHVSCPNVSNLADRPVPDLSLEKYVPDPKGDHWVSVPNATCEFDLQKLALDPQTGSQERRTYTAKAVVGRPGEYRLQITCGTITTDPRYFTVDPRPHNKIQNVVTADTSHRTVHVSIGSPSFSDDWHATVEPNTLIYFKSSCIRSRISRVPLQVNWTLRGPNQLFDTFAGERFKHRFGTNGTYSGEVVCFDPDFKTSDIIPFTITVGNNVGYQHNKRPEPPVAVAADPQSDDDDVVVFDEDEDAEDPYMTVE